MNSLALISDLIFREKIRTTAQTLNSSVEFIKANLSTAELTELIALKNPQRIFVDLNNQRQNALQFIELFLSLNTTVEIIAYCSHVDFSLIEQAKKLGLKRVMPRSEFFAELPSLIFKSS